MVVVDPLIAVVLIEMAYSWKHEIGKVYVWKLEIEKVYLWKLEIEVDPSNPHLRHVEQTTFVVV